MLSVNTSSLGNSSQASLGTQVVADDQGKKREIRLMKNRYKYPYMYMINVGFALHHQPYIS